MIVQAWNVEGPEDAERLQVLASTIGSHGADAVLLTGYRPSGMASLPVLLQQAGWPWRLDTHPGRPGASGLVWLGRHSLESSGEILVQAPHRWCEVLVVQPYLRLLGVHATAAGQPRFWRAVLHYAQERRHDPAILLGDFGAGEGDIWRHQWAELVQGLKEAGWEDAYRHLGGREEPTWQGGKGQGLRRDRAFVSAPARHRLVRAWQSHAERKRGESAHASLLLEITS